MTTDPAETLRAAAERAAQSGDPLHTALANWLDVAALVHNATMKAAAEVWDDPAEADARDAFVARQTDQAALAVARQVLGTVTQCPECGTSGACNGGPCPLGTVTAPPETEAAPVCICGHPEPQHFEDCCQVCDCGDYLEPAEARHTIARWRDAALTKRDGRRATTLREGADLIEQALIHSVTPAASKRDEVWDQAVRAAATELRDVADGASEEAQQPAPAVTEEEPEAPPLAVGDRYEFRARARTVTVTRLWVDEYGADAVAFEWRGGMSGAAHSVDMFHQLYRPTP